MRLATLSLLLVLSRSGGAEWFRYEPAGAVDGKGIYQETISRCPSGIMRQVRSADKATQCHESTHGIDSDISHLDSQEYGAFYVGNARCCLLPEPNVTIGQVARYVPKEQQTGRFRTYLSGDRVGRNCLSVLDEWTCYANDATCTRDLGLRDDGGLKFAREFSGFADCVVKAVCELDPQYSHSAELADFVAWQKKRVASIDQSAEASGDFMAEIPPEYRERNRASSCVHMSTAHILRYKELFSQADDWLDRYHGGESPGPHRRKLDGTGLKYAMTTDADDEFLEWCIANRLMVGVTTKPSHCINLVGRVTEDGKRYAVLLDNNRPSEYEYDDWDSWYRKYKRSGWAFTVTSGEVPPPSPN